MYGCSRYFCISATHAFCTMQLQIQDFQLGALTRLWGGGGGTNLRYRHFLAKHMQRQKNWVPLLGGMPVAPPGSTNAMYRDLILTDRLDYQTFVIPKQWWAGSNQGPLPGSNFFPDKKSFLRFFLGLNFVSDYIPQLYFVCNHLIIYVILTFT